MSDTQLAETIYHIASSIHPNAISIGVFEKKPDPIIQTNVKIKPFSVFSYSKDFNFLWGFEPKSYNGLDFCWHMEKEYKNGEATGNLLIAEVATDRIVTIIIWDGFPQNQKVGTIPIENWVTPIDWCVCTALRGLRIADFTARAKNCSTSSLLPNWRVLVLDLVSQNYPGSQSAALLKANPALLPWVRLYRPALQDKHTKWKDQFAAESDSWYALLRAMAKDDFTSLVEDIQAPERVLGLNSSYDTLEALASIWSANIVRPGDRHQVANIIAPLILFEGIRDRKVEKNTKDLENDIYSPLTFALAEELKTLQLIAVPEGGKRNVSLRLIEEIRSRTAQIKDLQIILLDDQYGLGYNKILEYIISGTATLDFHDTQKDIIDRLRAIFDMPVPIITLGWRKPIFDKPTILLLDLRLWANVPTMKKFYGDLKSLIAEYLKNIQEDADEQRKELLYDWREVEKQLTNYPDREDLLALTILPRLLSIVDPFLPIIIFSSSTQRQTLEAFKDFPNIITDFRKPIPSGYGVKLDSIEYIQALADTFERATEICRFRFIGEFVSDLEKKLFVDGLKISYDKFKNQSTLNYDDVVYFDPSIVCPDLRGTMMYFLQGSYRFLMMLPYVLMERWYEKATGIKFENVMPNSDYWVLADPRNDYVHGRIFCLDNQPDDIEMAFDVWKSFIGSLKVAS